MISILDYGTGNVCSIENMFKKIGVRAEIVSDKIGIKAATALVLPGVGSFDNGIHKLNASGIMEMLQRRVIFDKLPILGVCLGMQLLFEDSEEGAEPGLGWIPGHVRRFDFSGLNRCNLKIPHMGWNIAHAAGADSLFKGLDNDSRFYFVHSYHAVCSDASHILSYTEYGYQFVSAVQKENIFGVQFHPEKSHRFGMALLKNFAEIAGC